MEQVIDIFKDHDNPGTERFVGPWFLTQLTLSLSIGTVAFFVFCFARRVERWKVLYSPRTLLKGFSPHEVHDKPSFFGWILPTLRTSEFTVLQIVGLDAAVLLSFFRTAFLFFLTCTILAGTILVPINYRENGSSEGVIPELPPNSTDYSSLSGFPAKIAHGSTLYLTSHLLFTYLFTILALVFLQRNYARYIPLRQLFSLELAHSIPARTVMVTSLPAHLRSERTLAEYFEGIHLGVSGESGGLEVESVSVVRAVGGMKELLVRRTRALRILEAAWCRYLGNPVKGEGDGAIWGYVPRQEVERIVDPYATPSPIATPTEAPATTTTTGRLVNIDDDEDERGEDHIESNSDLEANLSQRFATPARTHIINPNRPRPTLRRSIFSKKIDALEFYAEEFRKADEEVKNRRKGKFRPTGVAFVTFESLAAAQIAAQTIHYPSVGEFNTSLAPEPRDIQWFNLTLSPTSVFVRQLLVTIALLILLSVWSIPVTGLARLLNIESIKKISPRFAAVIEANDLLRVFVSNSLPSYALVMFNNLLPYFLEALSVFQGLQARSWIEYSLLKKYHLSILFTTLFVFVTVSTWSLLQELSESPQKVLDKVAESLPGARNFFVSYVMLSGLAIMPLQLLELAVIIPRAFYKVFITRTPRDHAELNAPPMLNLGTVYPQAILIFTIGLTYSVITPVILPFTTIYFGAAYLVYKYKLLFVYYRPYESRGQAWPITFNRITWGLLIFQGMMLGLLIARQAFLLSVLMTPLILGTIYTSIRIHHTYRPLARFVNLSQACEVSHGGAGDIMKLRRGHPVTRSQSNLNRGRYGHNDEGVFVVGKNPATDYAQPPLSDSYPGVLNTGRRRYNHPALSGSLPDPWLPVLEEAEANTEVAPIVKDALVLDLRRRWSRVKRAARNGANTLPGVNLGHAPGEQTHGIADEDPSRAWRGSQASLRGMGDEDDMGVLALSDEENEEGLAVTRYPTYFHHRKSGVPGAFPSEREETDDED